MAMSMDLQEVSSCKKGGFPSHCCLLIEGHMISVVIWRYMNNTELNHGVYFVFTHCVCILGFCFFNK